MDPIFKAQILNQLNIYFYSRVSEYFDSSRQYFWPGWVKLSEQLEKTTLSVLDIGCGNGRFGEFMDSEGLLKHYHGIDTDIGLLTKGRERYPHWQFTEYDIIEKSLDLDFTYDLVVSFGVLHHIPSTELRQSFFQKLSELVNQNGLICLSTWNFKAIDPSSKRIVFGDNIIDVSQELATYIAEWKDKMELDFNTQELFYDWENQDYLLSWKRGETAIRFAHEYSQSEVEILSSQAGMQVVSTWTADGPGNIGNDYYLMKRDS